MDFQANNTAQQGSGLRRFAGIIITARNLKYGAFIVTGMIVAQAAFKDEWKPSVLGGQVIGDFVRGETDTARPAIVTTASQVANVQALAQAKAQQQVLAQQFAQQYGMITAMPAIFGSFAAQGACAYGTINDDPKYIKACDYVPALNAKINQQAGEVMDNLGTGRAFGEGPRGSGTIPAVADAAPLVQAEFDRIGRLQRELSAPAVAGCRKEAPGVSNNDRRTYLACLRVAAGEDQTLDAAGPRLVRHY